MNHSPIPDGSAPLNEGLPGLRDAASVNECSPCLAVTLDWGRRPLPTGCEPSVAWSKLYRMSVDKQALPRTRVSDRTPGFAVLSASAPHYQPDALGAAVRPLELQGHFPGLPDHLRVYVWRITQTPGERQAGACKIQLTGLGPGRDPGHLDFGDDAMVVVAGYHRELDVFALWDATAYDDPAGLAFSRNLQVRDSTLYDALASGYAEQARRQHGGIDEVVLAVPSQRFLAGCVRRWEHSLDRLVGGNRLV